MLIFFVGHDAFEGNGMRERKSEPPKMLYWLMTLSVLIILLNVLLTMNGLSPFELIAK